MNVKDPIENESIVLFGRIIENGPKHLISHYYSLSHNTLSLPDLLVGETSLLNGRGDFTFFCIAFTQEGRAQIDRDCNQRSKNKEYHAAGDDCRVEARYHCILGKDAIVVVRLVLPHVPWCELLGACCSEGQGAGEGDGGGTQRNMVFGVYASVSNAYQPNIPTEWSTLRTKFARIRK